VDKPAAMWLHIWCQLHSVALSATASRLEVGGLQNGHSYLHATKPHGPGLPGCQRSDGLYGDGCLPVHL